MYLIAAEGMEYDALTEMENFGQYTLSTVITTCVSNSLLVKSLVDKLWDTLFCSFGNPTSISNHVDSSYIYLKPKTFLINQGSSIRGMIFLMMTATPKPLLQKFSMGRVPWCSFFADHMNPPGLFDDVDEFGTILMTAPVTSTIVGAYGGVNVYQKQLDDIQSQTSWLDDVSMFCHFLLFVISGLLRFC